VRILVVEDDATAREALVHLLRGDDHETVGAGNGQEAVSLLESVDPELLILDYRLPDRDGLELLAEARSRDPEQRWPAALLVTAHLLGPAARAAAAALGALVLQKPLAPGEFLSTVRRFGSQRSPP
jgi:CheY-like chemotaxis protein